MKKLMTLLFSTLALIIAPLKSGVAARAADDNPFPQNYLRLAEDETTMRWKHVNNMQDGAMPGVQTFATENGVDGTLMEREPIIFFNTNPIWNIVDIIDIYVRVTDINGNEFTFCEVEPGLDGQGVFDWYFSYIESGKTLTLERKLLTKISKDQYSYGTYLEGQKAISAADRESILFTWENGGFKQEIVTINTKYDGVSHYALPRIGKTTILNNWYQHMGQQEHGASMIDSSLFQYRSTGINDGYTSVNEATSSSYVQNPNWYLILPLAMTSGLVIDYLAVEAIDIDGNIISPIIDFTEEEDDKISFQVEKRDGEWETPNAVYFPGRNAYYASGLLLEEYVVDESVESNPPVVVMLGNLINRDSIDENRLKQSNRLYINQQKNIHYDFTGDTNCLIVTIPDNVLTAVVKITFAKGIGHNQYVQDPFYINLLDEYGNYGIRGALPLENDPNANASIWDRLRNGFKSLFDFTKFGFTNPLDTIMSVFKIALIVAFAALVIYAGFKIGGLIRVASKKKKVRRR